MLRNTVGALALALACFVSPLAAVPAQAEAFSITEADPIAVVTVPDDWSGKKISRGIQIKTPDDEIYMWFELIAPGEIDAVQKEHDGYFGSQGVSFVSQPESITVEINNRPWAISEVKAKSKDGSDSVIRYVAINPKVASGKIILLTYWASLEGEKTHDAATNKMFESLAFK